MADRIGWLDRARGLGILVVVLGHNPALKGSLSVWHDFFFLFHMPLFFILAGLVYKSNGVSDYLNSRFRSIMVPYLVVGTFFAVLAGKLNLPDTLTGLGALLSGIGDLMAQPHLWFLPTLFLVGLLRTFASRTLAKSTLAKMTFLVACLVLHFFLLSLHLGVSIRSTTHEYYALPWSLDLVPIGLFFFSLGNFLGPFLKLRFAAKSGSAVTMGAGLVLLSGIYIIAAFTNTAIDFNHRIFSGSLWVLSALVGSAAVVLIAVGSLGKFGSLLSYLGSRSMVIFIFHYLVQAKLARVIPGSSGAAFAALMAIFVPLLIDVVIRRFGLSRCIFYPSMRRG